MNIRVLDKNDKAALEQLIFTIENALPVPEWWIPIDDIERSHFFDADWTCFLGAFNDDNELVAASALFFNEHEFAEEAEKLGLDIHSTNVAEVGRCMVHPDFRGHNLMCELNKRLCSIARNRGIDTILAVAHPDNVASNSSFRRLGAELKATATVFGSYQRNMYISGLQFFLKAFKQAFATCQNIPVSCLKISRIPRVCHIKSASCKSKQLIYLLIRIST